MNEETTKVTTKEFQAILGDGFNTQEDYLMVNMFLKFLVRAGIAKEAGTQPMPAGQRGKPSSLFELPKAMELVFFPDENDLPEPVSTSGAESVPVVPAPISVDTVQNNVQTEVGKDSVVEKVA